MISDISAAADLSRWGIDDGMIVLADDGFVCVPDVALTFDLTGAAVSDLHRVALPIALPGADTALRVGEALSLVLRYGSGAGAGAFRHRWPDLLQGRTPSLSSLLPDDKIMEAVRDLIHITAERDWAGLDALFYDIIGFGVGLTPLL